jgi:hypothetical protein
VIYHFKDLHLQISFFLPQPQKFQFIWLTSLIPAIIGLVMIFLNLSNLLQLFQYTNIIFGLVPVLFTTIFNMSDLWNYVKFKQTKELFHGFPLIVIWYMILIIKIQIHMFSFYFTRLLINNWKIVKKNKPA